MSRRGARTALRLGVAVACMAWASAPYPARAQEGTELSADAYALPATDPPSVPPAANSETAATLEDNLSRDTPEYFRRIYQSFMAAPLPKRIYDQGGIPRFVPQLEIDRDPAGKVGSYQPMGPTETATNAFFLSLGTNGRSCVTCHQPPSGMSVSVQNIRKRFRTTGGKDPIFAPVDGANCPNLVPAQDTSGSLYGGRKGRGRDFRAAHSLLLNKGLIRIPLPVPPGAEYTIKVVSDPTTCNLDPAYSLTPDGKTRVVSVFRRPILSANLNFKTSTISFGPPSPITNIMFDGREPTLFTQAVSATLGHAQAVDRPTQEQLDQIVDFETHIFSAQLRDNRAGRLDAAGATGGPINLSVHGNDSPSFPPPPAFDEYAAWADAPAERRQSIFRGQQLFHGVGGESGDRGTFLISSVAGFNDAIGVPALPGACSTCHNFSHGGSDVFAASQRDIAIGGQGSPIGGPSPATDLPIFELTCPAGSFLWDPTLTKAYTNDPGKALITGRCRDIGAKTIPTIRALSAHAPYFSDGSAASVLDVVEHYDERFEMGLTYQEKVDLVNFLNAL